MTIDLTDYIFIDHHAHSLLTEHHQIDAIGFRQCFSESTSMSQLEEHIGTSVPYMDMIHNLESLLNVRPEQDIISYRTKQSEKDYLNLLWDDVSIGALIVDDGFRQTDMMDLQRLSSLCQRPVYRCIRLESLLEQCLQTADSIGELTNLFQTNLQDKKSTNVVALKTIAAYRGGLKIDTISANAARADFDDLKSQFKTSNTVRISRGALYHYILSQAFEIAAFNNWPVQVHTGIGDDDEDLNEANPIQMQNILKSQHFTKTKFVFLHCYPFVREAAYLASLYPNVYIDVSLAVSLASPSADGMVLDALSLAPTSKILAGTDGHSVPETHWYGALKWRQSLERALNYFLHNRYLTEEQCFDVAARILHENAQRIYNLENIV